MRTNSAFMDYFKAAFGVFAPHRDEDAAVKFALNVVLMDNRLQELAELVVDGNQLGGIEGEPGWMLERRDAADEGGEAAAYPDRPAGARFKASVDEDAYRIQHPELQCRNCRAVEDGDDVQVRALRWRATAARVRLPW